MLDVLFLSEILWCLCLIRVQNPRRALTYATGMATAGYAGVSISKWVTRVVFPPASPTIHWIEKQVAITTAHSKAVFAPFLPAEPAALTVSGQTQWLALQVAQAMFMASIAIAVFLLFIVGDKVNQALWDRGNTMPSRTTRLLGVSVGLASGLYLYALSGWMFATLEWITPSTPLQQAVSRSLGLHFLGALYSHVL